MRGIDAIPIEYAYAGYFPATNFDVFIERRDRAMSIESPRVCSCIDVRFADINIYIYTRIQSLPTIVVCLFFIIVVIPPGDMP